MMISDDYSSKIKGQKEFIYWALSGCLVNNGVTS